MRASYGGPVRRDASCSIRWNHITTLRITKQPVLQSLGEFVSQCDSKRGNVARTDGGHKGALARARLCRRKGGVMVRSFHELPLLMTPKQLADATGEHVNSIRRSIAAGGFRRTRLTGGSTSAGIWCSQTRRREWWGMATTRAPAERWWPGAGAGALAGAPGCGGPVGYGPEGAASAVAATPAAMKIPGGILRGDSVAHTATGGASPWHR